MSMPIELGSEESWILESLINGPETDRAEGVQTLNDPEQEVDRIRLQVRILEILSHQDEILFKPTGRSVPKIEARPWLFCALAGLSIGNERISSLVRQHLFSETETDPEIRFRAFEGLVYSNPPDIEFLSRRLLEKEDSPQVRQLAGAVLAQRGDKSALKEIMAGIHHKDPSFQESTLRALGVIPLRPAVKPLCSIIADTQSTTLVSLAIAALGRVQGKRSIETTAHFLSTFVSRINGILIWHKPEIQALYTLGRLKSPVGIPTLVKALCSSRAEIIAEAARALGKLEEPQATADRLVEAVKKSDRIPVARLCNLLRRKGLKAAASQVESAAQCPVTAKLGDSTITPPYEGNGLSRDNIKEGVTSMDRMALTLGETDKAVKELFEDSFQETRNDFRMTTLMGAVVFLLGISLVALSAWLILSQKGNLQGWYGLAITGLVGAVGVVYGVLTAQPRRQMRESVEQLMYLRVIFLAYMRQLNQADQAYSRRLQDNDSIVAQDVDEFSKMVGTAMQSAVGYLSFNHASGAKNLVSVMKS